MTKLTNEPKKKKQKENSLFERTSKQLKKETTQKKEKDLHWNKQIKEQTRKTHKTKEQTNKRKEKYY